MVRFVRWCCVCVALVAALGGQAARAGGDRPGVMVFAATAGDNWDLYSWSGRAGDAVQRLTDTLYDEKSPALSADRGSLAYVTSGGRLRIRDMSGGVDRELDTGEYIGRWDSPTFSPDGNYLACTYSVGTARDNSALAIIDLRSGEIRFPLSQYGPQYSPAWAPAADALIFGYAHCDLGCGRILQEPWLLDVAAGEARQLLLSSSMTADFAWQPGARSVVYSANPDGDFDIWQYRFDDGTASVLVSARGLDESPAFSPDGRSIVFVSNRSGSSRLWIKDLGNDSERELVPLGLDAGMTFRDVTWR